MKGEEPSVFQRKRSKPTVTAEEHIETKSFADNNSKNTKKLPAGSLLVHLVETIYDD